MTPGPGIQPGSHWWEASALTTAPTLLHNTKYFWLKTTRVVQVSETASTFFKKMTILNTFISPFSSKPRTRVLRLLPGICFFFIEIFTILHYANEKSDDVIGGSTKTVQHSINNVSRIIKAVFFKLGTMYITKERKWHSLCHDNSNAAGAALIKIFIPRFYLK